MIRILIVSLAAWLAGSSFSFAAAGLFGHGSPRIVFPNDPSVLDARRDFGAKGDGKTDDTAALQAAIESSSGATNHRGTCVLFIPNGTYRVTDTLVVKKAVGPWVYGESRDGVVIRLADGVGTNVHAVLRTHPKESGKTSADWFMRNFRNLTIDVGNNPEVDGIRFYGNNSGIVQNVRVTGRGKVGINAGFYDQNGPNLIQDCEIDGFETGVRSAWSWGGTISRVTIRNCRKEGLYVSANAVGVEDLVVENTPCAVRNDFPNDWPHWGGVVALVGGRFSAKNSDQPAIDNRSVLYARDVKTSGFKAALRSAKKDSTNDWAGPDITEFTSSKTKQLFDGPTNTLRLAIKREPEFPWETDTNRWICANDFGAKAGDNRNDTDAMQKAIDAAAAAKKTVVYLRGIGGGDPNWYTINGEVRVHGSVRHVIGLGFGRVIGGANGKFVVDDSSAPVVKFQNLQAFGGKHVAVENRSAKNTLVVEGCDLKIIGAGKGDIFATDCPSHVELRSPGQRIWARQLNPEGTSDTGLVQNNGADLWVLGVKFEGAGVRFKTSGGGRTEAFGMFNYGPGNLKKDDARPMFDIDNASFSIAGVREITFGASTFPMKVRERRGEETRTLGNDKEQGWIGWALFRAGQVK